MYLKSLWELSTGGEPVGIASVAARLGISPVSASEMIHRLEERRLVEHQRYRGVRLTRPGRDHARALIRRHRLWERFLADELGLPWESVHDLACELEHAVGAEVTKPGPVSPTSTCPHGNPIPTASGEVHLPSATPLADLETNATATVACISPESGALLSYLAARGIVPGAKIRIAARDPYGGFLQVRVGKRSRFGRGGAAHVFAATATAAG
jgi:DtxR family Mn-dependent transcriptional regulator